jgi:lysophospholipase L1-like esterase
VLPDLVVWQVGARDAMARVDPDEFAASLAAAVTWFRENRIDLVLVEPPYSERRATDDYFLAFVKAIGAVAEREQVPLIRRYEAMRALAAHETRQNDEPPDPMQLTELGYRCLGHYVADTIIRGIRLASGKGP